MEFDLEEIVSVAFHTIRETQLFIRDELNDLPFSSPFEVAFVGTRKKQLLHIDLLAEKNTQHALRRRLKRYPLYTIGEESLNNEQLNLTNQDKLVVLMDMVDGTDLLERGLSNWCSAMIFYYPPQRRIVASFVALPDECVYYATEKHDEPVYKIPFHGRKPVKVTGPSKVRNLKSASVAFYGQKIKNYLSVATHKNFCSHLEDIQQKTSRLKTRIYNFAGNPFMIRLIDGHTRIDAVFDIQGQAPHDVVPGAFIAKKAGAIFRDIDGNEIDLGNSLLRPADPKSRIRYIVASTEKLYSELRDCLHKPERPIKAK
jgi:fructose-1,6-bisphosphatase/inositol monophosphatase family enzyme